MIPLLILLGIVTQAPDSLKQGRFGAALNTATDSLDRLRGATSAFRLDLDHASAELVTTRARSVRAACAGAMSALVRLDAVLAAELYAPAAAAEQSALRTRTAALRGATDRCTRDWDPGSEPTVARADSLRAWGPYRTSQLEEEMRRFLSAARAFMKKSGVPKPAKG